MGLWTGRLRGLVQLISRIGPLLSAGLASPGICRIYALEHRVFGATLGTCGRLELGRVHFGLVQFGLIQDLLRDGLRRNAARLIELIGGDQDARIADAEGITRSRLLDPAFDTRAAQNFGELGRLHSVVTLA